jgi:multicomponent Na+:H+ antiporter subunit F
VDICLIYAMISFLAVVVLTRIYTGVYREAQERKNKEGGDSHADS